MSPEPEVNTKRFGELVTEAIADVQTLIRQSIDLAVAELKAFALLDADEGRRGLARTHWDRAPFG